MPSEEPPVQPEAPVEPEAPVQPPQSPPAVVTPGTGPDPGPVPSAAQDNEPTQGRSAAPGKHGRIGRLRDKINSGEPLKPLTIIVTAIVAFVFGIASNQSTDLVKGADECYDALTQYDENVSSDFWELNHDFHRPGDGSGRTSSSDSGNCAQIQHRDRFCVSQD
jgi:hypothetical protein